MLAESRGNSDASKSLDTGPMKPLIMRSPLPSEELLSSLFIWCTFLWGKAAAEDVWGVGDEAVAGRDMIFLEGTALGLCFTSSLFSQKVSASLSS